MLVQDIQTIEALRRLAAHGDWPALVRLAENTFAREGENLLLVRDSNRVFHQQGYVQAVKDFMQAFRSANPSLPHITGAAS